MLDNLFGTPDTTIDRVLAKRVGLGEVRHYRTAWKQLPSFRFVDLFQAIESIVGERSPITRIESQHQEDLNGILHAAQPAWAARTITRAPRITWASGPDDEILLPVDFFWVAPYPMDTDHKIVARLRYITHAATSLLELAARSLSTAEDLMKEIIEVSSIDSIYRNQTLNVAFQTGTKDEYGDVEKPEQLRITFKQIPPVADDDIVIDEDVRRMLMRNVVDLHERRDLLKEIGVPIRRGVLLYGPPGTGKTYACRYLAGKLKHATKIMVTGSALLQVGHIFQLARLLQPSVVFLEDVDLVFMSREINLYSSVLGELLDQMDGLRPFEDIGFVLTTNALERMEAAVRDRPGRISQLIRFGAPGAELRSRYLSHYLKPYDRSDLDHDTLVRISEGATQAFLKEWVHRAVQVGSERIQEASDALTLRTADFEETLREMKAYSSGATGRIIGFHE